MVVQVGLTARKKIKILGGNIQLKRSGEGSSFYFSLDFPISTLQESQLEDKPLVKYDASKLMNKKDSCG
jgi:hypothetical protein